MDSPRLGGPKLEKRDDWSLYPHMTDFWRLLQDEVFSGLSDRPHFFIDLEDSSSRSAGDIREMGGTLRGFKNAGPLTLGLNGNNANVPCRWNDLPVARPGPFCPHPKNLTYEVVRSPARSLFSFFQGLPAPHPDRC
jgi:hypothetical protein